MKISIHSLNLFLTVNLLISPILSWAQPSPSDASTNQSRSATFFSKERWGVNYLNYINGPTFSEAKGASINHYLTLKLKFSPDWALSAVVQPDSNFWNGSSFLTMGDAFLRMDYPTIYKGENGLKISGDLRYYIPFSEGSRNAKIAGVISATMKATLDVGRVSFLYLLIPKFYLNTQYEVGQKVASHGHYASVAYNLSPKLSVDFALYPAWTLKRDQPVEFNDMPAYPGFTANFSESFSLSPYLEIPLFNARSKTVSAGALLSYTLL